VTAFRIVIISPPGYRHAAAFHEVAETLYHAIRSLGYPVAVDYNRFMAGAVHIVLGSNLVTPAAAQSIPPDSIIYNLEQIDPESRWWHDGLKHLVTHCETWDYSERNVKTFASLGVMRPVLHVPLGFVPELSRITMAMEEDIDVLFYGSGNERRQQVIDTLRERGLRVTHLFGIYGRERDAAIARAKVVLSMHLYPAQILETVRIGYLLANHKAVVAECGPDTSIEPGIEAAVRLARYDSLVDACVDLVTRPAERAQLAYAGYRWVTRRPMATVLAPHLERIVNAREAVQLPAPPPQLKLGGFNTPLDGWLCVDEANPAADIVLRADGPLPLGRTRDTLRYGRVALEAESFDVIDAGDWPMRTDDFEGFMRECARLLRFGGKLSIRVPHELSGEAWADPRSRRAFSDRSFGMFGDAHASLGWGDAALELTDLQLELTPLGSSLKAQGADVDNLSRTPRAVEKIQVTLTRRGYRALPGADH